jgi:signal transduction histidine kinase
LTWLLVGWTLLTLWGSFIYLIVSERAAAIDDARAQLTSAVNITAKYVNATAAAGSQADDKNLASLRETLRLPDDVTLILVPAASLPPEMDDGANIAAVAALTDGQRIVVAYRSRSDALEEWWASVRLESIGLLAVSAGMVLLSLVLARQLARRELAQVALIEAKLIAETANIAKSQFLANMSHELRTPLNAIIGFTEMMIGGHAGAVASKQLNYLQLVHESGTHLLAVVNDLLDLVRIETGKLVLQDLEPVDAAEIARSAMSMVRARAAKLDLSLDVEPSLPGVFADAVRLKQILLNLLGNAVKFTPPGGAVQLQVQRSRAGIDFTVSDTGPGMSPSEIDIALQPFRQLDEGMARHHDGVGLGLPLSKQLVELHDGGEMIIDSEKGHGTRITVRLTHIAEQPSSPVELQAEMVG